MFRAAYRYFQEQTSVLYKECFCLCECGENNSHNTLLLFRLALKMFILVVFRKDISILINIKVPGSNK